MVKTTGLYPAVGSGPGNVPAVGLVGTRLLTETIRVTGLGDHLSQALSPWRRPWPVPVGTVCAASPGRGLRVCCVCPNGLAAYQGPGRGRRSG